MITRQHLLGCILGGSVVAITGLGAAAAETPRASRASIKVPLDHSKPAAGSIEIDHLTVGAFDPRKPTVFVVEDGQQFFIRDDVMPSFRELFGPDVNIVGLPGRGRAPALLAAVSGPDGVDWRWAYQCLRYRQWADDIEAVRRALVGRGGKILVYGVSGGGRLAHEYLSVHGANVERCYTESAVFTPIEAELGLQHDHFWSEIPPDERAQLTAALAQRPGDGDFYAQLLQRQNFFVPPADLAAARRTLIDQIARNDAAQLAAAAAAYQVSALTAMMETSAALPIRVREFEFVAPILANRAPDPEAFLPDIQVSRLWARPLLDLQAAGQIDMPSVDLAALNQVQAQVTVVAGRYDHTCDYRSQIALASHYPHHRLILLDDDHQMHRLKALAGARPALLQAWTRGFADPAYAAAIAALEPIRWQEA